MGIARVKDAVVVAGSEEKDGDLNSGVVPTGTIISKTCYNTGRAAWNQ